MMLTAGQITVRFKQIIDKPFLPKRFKLKQVKHLAHLLALIPLIKDIAAAIVVTPFFVSILYVLTYITSC